MSANEQHAYRTLCERFGAAGRLYAAKISLFWDSQTYMPKGGAWSRGEQLAAIDAARRDLIAAPDAEQLFAAAEAALGVLGSVERANLREMRRLWRHDAAVPKALLMEKARAVATAQSAWVSARQANDFDSFAKDFAVLMPLNREIAAAKANALDLAPYDALMDEADPGLTAAIVDPIFGDLASALPALLAEVAERQASWPAPIPFVGDCSAERQRALAYKLTATVGHSAANLRIDIAPHPFTLVGSPGDNRITVRFDPRNFRFAVMATLHESGHALYESGLPREHAFLPVGTPRGATAHESQSLMVEMQASRSREFLSWLAPQLAQAFGGDPACWSTANVVNAYRRIDAGHIRIEADEISYPLHVILRYRIERALLSGDLAIADLPGAWSDLSHALLGRRPPNHTVGCLQDIHWAAGLFGYFPNYALGAAFAAQLFERAVRDDPAVLRNLRDGDFAPYRAWVGPRIHARASEVPFAELVVDVTGAPLSAESLKRHLRRRYLEEA
ncbi:MAG: carboxypeptidase M32 [Acetobacteraceae bacterium]